MDRKVIEAYAAEAPELGKSIAGLSREQMLAFPVPGTWSIQQIVLHIVDTDLVIADRMKRVIAEDNPTLLGFDQTQFTARLHYEEQDAALVCELFAKNRQVMAALLRLLKDEDFCAGGNAQRARADDAGGDCAVCIWALSASSEIFAREARAGEEVSRQRRASPAAK